MHPNICTTSRMIFLMLPWRRESSSKSRPGSSRERWHCPASTAHTYLNQILSIRRLFVCLFSFLPDGNERADPEKATKAAAAIESGSHIVGDFLMIFIFQFQSNSDSAAFRLRRRTRLPDNFIAPKGVESLILALSCVSFRGSDLELFSLDPARQFSSDRWAKHELWWSERLQKSQQQRSRHTSTSFHEKVFFFILNKIFRGWNLRS